MEILEIKGKCRQNFKVTQGAFSEAALWGETLAGVELNNKSQ